MDNLHEHFNLEQRKRDLVDLRAEISAALGFEWSGYHNDLSAQLHAYAMYLDLISEGEDLRHLGASAYLAEDPSITLHCIQSTHEAGVFELTMMNDGNKIYRHVLALGVFTPDHIWGMLQ